MTSNPQDDGLAFKVFVSSSCSLAIMLVDFGLLRQDEIKYIWPVLRESWVAKLYMLARYFGIVNQIFSVCFAMRMYLGIPAPFGCHVWFGYQAIVVQLLLGLAQYLIMYRLYALFLCHPSILLMLASFGISQVASMGVSVRFSFVGNEHTDTCLLMRSNPGNAFFSTTTATVYLTSLMMTFCKWHGLPKAFTRGKFGRVLFRDMMVSQAAIAFIMLFMTLCSLGTINPSMSGNITYYWFVCILWIAIGRITINHERLRATKECEQEEDRNWKPPVQLTSQIEMGTFENTWLLDETLNPSRGWSVSPGYTATSSTLYRTPRPPASVYSRPLSWTGADEDVREHGHGNGYIASARRTPSPRPSSPASSTRPI